MLTEQLDYLCFAALMCALYAGVAAWLWRSRAMRLPRWLIFAALLVLAAGWIPVQRAGQAEEQRVQAMLLGFAPTYALEMARMGHAALRLDTPGDDPRFLQMIDVQKRWLAVNPAIASVYTLRQRPDGKFVFVVGAEVDYNHDGVYSGPRERRVLPGDVYEEAGVFWQRGLKGETAFDDRPYTDEWGTWVSAVTPMYDADGRIEGVLGVDYDAETFGRAVQGVREVVIGLISLVLLSMLAIAVIATLQGAYARAILQRQALERDKDLAEAASHAKSAFLSNMSHELRTPLHAIIAFTKLAQQKLGPGPDKVWHYLTRIHASSERLLNLLNDLLDLSKLEAGKTVYAWDRLDLRGVVQEVIAEYDALATEKSVHVILTGETIGPIEGDAVRLGQVVRNLLSNALKFTARESIVRIALSNQPARLADGRPHTPALLLTVSDEGIGIPADELELVFDKFVQSTRTHTGAGGTGLGLAICRAIVEDHGGRIWASNNPERGATFSVLLPVERIAPAEHAKAA